MTALRRGQGIDPPASPRPSPTGVGEGGAHVPGSTHVPGSVHVPRRIQVDKFRPGTSFVPTMRLARKLAAERGCVRSLGPARAMASVDSQVAERGRAPWEPMAVAGDHRSVVDERC